MAEYVGLDVSMKDTAVSVRRDGKRVWRGKCGSDPRLIAEVIRRRAPNVARFEDCQHPDELCTRRAGRCSGQP
jgi:transposase